MTGTPEATLALLDRAALLYPARSLGAAEIAAARSRLAEPLRVAVAGKVKAGKSTLVNALLGEQLAATDAGECTLVTTWYRYGPAPAAVVFLRDGRQEELALRGRAHGSPIDLGGHRPDAVAQLEVTWPLPILESLTLIDTPGVGSLTREASERTVDLVRPEGGVPGVDALVYLLRHRHATDLELLRGFHADTRGALDDAGVTVLGVLSRADELGEQGIDAMLRSQGLADAYARDPEVAELCGSVVPVAGLLAQGAQTMTHDEFTALLRYAEIPKERRDRLTLSAARFVGADEPLLDAAQRFALVARLGIFGVKLGASLVRLGFVTPDALAAELLRRSGLPTLTDALASGYAASAELLKARSALRALAGVLTAHPCPGSADLADDLDAVRLAAADLAELSLAVRLRRDGLPGLDAAQTERALRLLDWAAPGRQTPLPRGVQAPDLTAELAQWRAVANDPLLPSAARRAAETLGRLCERLTPASTG